MQAKLLTEEEKKLADREFKSKVKELDNILDKTASVLSSFTNQAGVVLFPLLYNSQFKHVEFIRIDDSRVLVVLMTSSGMAEDFIIDIDDGIDARSLLQIGNFINSNIAAGSLNNIRKDIMQRLLAQRDSFFYTLERAKELIDSMLDIIKEDKLFLNGRSYIAEQPEFKDIDKLKAVFRLLEDEDILLSLLKKRSEAEGVKIYIGSELGDDFTDCSLITTNYCLGESPCGTLGIIGPTRMEYAKLVSMVEYIASNLSRVLG
jgi:heat-inducible transcriptional repressor